MNAAHFHLVVNHLPILFPVVGVIVMLIGLIFKSEAVKRTAYFIFILGALSSIVAMNSGEEAEEVVEKISGISENHIESHEEAAELFAIVSYLLGAISLIGLWASSKKKSFSAFLTVLTLVLAVVLIFFGQRTGTSGGEIMHQEIRSGYSAPTGDVGETGEEAEEEDED